MSIIAVVYILIVLCGAGSLIIDFLVSRKKIMPRPVPAVYRILDRIFYVSNLPAVFISFSAALISFFYRGEGVSILIILAATAAFSFAVEHLREHLSPPAAAQIKNTEVSEYRAFFACMESYNKIQTFHEDIFSSISEHHTAFTRRVENAAAALLRTATDMGGYALLQDEQSRAMLDNKNSCEAAFIQLRESADRYNAAFTSFEKKLGAANRAIEYSPGSETLQNDLETSFKELFLHNSMETRTQIDRIVSSLNSLVYKCSQFPSLTTPYQNMISIYSSRMESALAAFENKNKKLQDALDAVIDSVSAHERMFQTMLTQMEQNIAAFSKALVKYKEKIDKRLAGYHKDYNSRLEALNTERKRWKKRLIAAAVLSISGVGLLIGIGIHALTGPASVAIRLAQEKRALQAEYTEAEKRYNELQEKSNAALADLQAKSTESLAELQKKYNTLNYEKNTLQAKNNDLQKNYVALQTKNNDLQSVNNELQSKNNRLNNVFGITINSMSAGNWNNNRWITAPGGVLRTSDVYRLRFQVRYTAAIDKNIRFDVKWYYPGNDLRTKWDENTPSGYTFSFNQSINSNGSQFDFANWGWDTPGKFPRGVHKIELYTSGICLYTFNFELR